MSALGIFRFGVALERCQVHERIEVIVRVHGMPESLLSFVRMEEPLGEELGRIAAAVVEWVRLHLLGPVESRWAALYGEAWG